MTTPAASEVEQKPPKKPKPVRIEALRGTVLGFVVFRGYAPLSLLARISRPDVYDQVTNPTGTQRDLKPKHAAEVYDYAAKEEKAFFPEIVLNVRSWDDENITWESSGEAGDEKVVQFGTLSIDIDFFATQPEVLISRVDGNHRLAYADGSNTDYGPIDRLTSFCLLNIEEWDPIELKIFKDVNENPVRMSATHLYQAIVRLQDPEALKKETPHIWMADQLGSDPKSVFSGQVYRGAGSKGTYLIKLNQIATSIQELLNTSQKLDVIVPEISDQYALVREFWSAVRRAMPEVFEKPRKYVVLKSPGLYAMGRVCAAFLDEGLVTSQITSAGDLKDPDFFYDKLAKAAVAFDWSTEAHSRGFRAKQADKKSPGASSP